jgi:hypothetical protein
MHWDGTQWTIYPVPPTGQRGELFGVSAVSTNDVWAVGVKYPGGPYVPLILHYDGVQWSEVSRPEQPGGMLLNDVVALASNDVWAVGANDGFHSTITMHWDGAAWTIVPSPNPGFLEDNVLTAVSAVAPNDIWAVGYLYPKGGSPTTITIHWDGTQWSHVPSPNPGNYFRQLYGVTAVAPNDIWAVGSYSPDLGTTYLPMFLHYDGASWTHVPGPVFPDYSVLRDVHAVAADDIWAVGTNAVDNFAPFETLIMHYDGVSWTRVFSPNGGRTFSRLYGVTAVNPDELWSVGFSDDYGFPYRSNTIQLRLLCYTGTTTPIPTRTATTLPPTSTALAATQTPTPQQPTSTQPAVTSTAPVPTGTAVSTSTTVPPSATRTGTAQAATATTTTVASATATGTACTVTFTDVEPGSTFHPYVMCLACRGVVSGYSDGTFRPNNPVTRGQLSKIVSNSAGFSEPVSGQSFEDVPEGSSFYSYIERLASRGILAGYTCGRPGEPCVPPANRPYFRPFTNVTRGQTSKIVAVAAQIPDPEPGAQTFEDVPTTHTFYLWIEALVERGVMSGYPCGGPGEPCGPGNRPYFRPSNDVTRGQSSKIVANTFFPECEGR